MKTNPTELNNIMKQAETIKPAFADTNTVTIVLAADNTYVPYLSTLLQSIAEATNNKRNYDIIVFTADISRTNRAILRKQIEMKNISLRFFKITEIAKGRLDDLKLRGHFQIETYYRLLMQEVLVDWDKVLYLDSDMIVLRDVAELFDTNIEGYLLAACKDADTAGLYNGYDPSRKKYTDKVLRLKNPFDYFQAGTILFNLKKFRETFNVDDMLELASSEKWKLLDQDVLNVLAQGCVKYIPMEWNVLSDWRGLRIKRIISRAPENLREEYACARKHPAIIHYAGPEKPWNDPSSDMANYFWRFAKLTPYIDELKERLAQNAGKKKLISDSAWDVLYPIYARVMPDGSKRREFAAEVYRKLVAGKKG